MAPPGRLGTVNDSLHIDLDGAWEPGTAGLPTLDLRGWGPRVRYVAPVSEMEALDREAEGKLPPFVLFGSGDFHHLSGLWVRRAARRGDDLTVVSFDNHPDWDVRPPAVGVRRVGQPRVGTAATSAAVSVWGCGNFELRLPRAAVRQPRRARYRPAAKSTPGPSASRPPSRRSSTA